MDSHPQSDGSHSYITVIPVDYPRGRGYATQSSDYLNQYNDYSDHTRDDYRHDYNISSEPQFDKIGPLYAPPPYEREKSHVINSMDRDALEREDRELRVRERSQHNQMGDVDWERDRERERSQHRHMQHDRTDRDRWQHSYLPPPVEREREREREQREREREEEWEQERVAHLANMSTVSHDACASIKDANNLMGSEPLSEKIPQHLINYQYAGAPLKMCVYLMSRIALHMELEDGESTTTSELMSAVLQEEELGLPASAGALFSLWMCSRLLELQLKPHHRPFEIRKQWPLLLMQYCSVSESRIERDEPILSFQRNIFFPRLEEEKIKDYKALSLLYEEARYNILEGRYPCDVSNYLRLGGMQARIELGAYKPDVHTTQYFREQQDKFLPRHVRKTTWSWLPVSGKNSPEVRLLEEYKMISNTSEKKLIRKYLDFCWRLPFYGSAFFQGQIEQPVRGLTSLITHQDVPVLVAINSQGVHVIDDTECIMLLGLKYEELSWDFAKPSQENNENCLPCLFLQFMVVENGSRVSKILQVFSKQAVLMDSLISVFVEELKRSKCATLPCHDETDRPMYDTSTDSDADTQIPLTVMGRQEVLQSCLSNKLNRLTLATFDEEGHVIAQSGSWSFSY